MKSFVSLLTLSLLASPLFAIPLLSLSPRADCSSSVQKLVDGINSNIAVQKDEASQASILASILSADTINKDDFASAKSKLIDIVNKGIAIRTNNQKIAPPGNAAIPGLSKVASAQSDELKLANGLTADSQGAKDVTTLKTDFANGIKQNQQNAKDAATGCTANKRDLLTRDDSGDYAE